MNAHYTFRINAAASLAMPRAGCAVAVVDGGTFDGGRVHNLDDIWAYGPAEDRWRLVGTLPFPTRAAGGFADEEQFVVAGGHMADFSAHVFLANPRNGTVAPAGSLPHGLTDTRFVRAGPRIIAVIGECARQQRRISGRSRGAVLNCAVKLAERAPGSMLPLRGLCRRHQPLHQKILHSRVSHARRARMDEFAGDAVLAELFRQLDPEIGSVRRI